MLDCIHCDNLLNNGLKQLNKNPIFFIKLDKMETTWVGLDIYQPKKVEKYLKLNLMHTLN